MWVKGDVEVGAGTLYLVQRALGHGQITTTEIYAKVSDDALRRAVAGGLTSANA